MSAAASLKNAFEDYAKSFDAADVSFSFAGSDELAAQIRQGVRAGRVRGREHEAARPAVREGLVEKPVLFAVEPARDRRARRRATRSTSLADLAQAGGHDRGRRRATRPDRLLHARGAGAPGRSGEAQAIERNIRSNEPDVAGIVGKVSQGAVDAGFVYVTDVRAAEGKLIGDPAARPASAASRLRRRGGEGSAASRPRRGRSWTGLLSGAGQRALQDAGFGPPRRVERASLFRALLCRRTGTRAAAS